MVSLGVERQQQETIPRTEELSPSERVARQRQKINGLTARIALGAGRSANRADLHGYQLALNTALDELAVADRDESIENGLSRFASTLTAPQLANLALTLFESNGQLNGETIVTTMPEDLDSLHAVAVERTTRTRHPEVANEFQAYGTVIEQQARWLRNSTMEIPQNFTITRTDSALEMPNTNNERSPITTLIGIIEHPEDATRVLMTEDGRYFVATHDKTLGQTFEEAARKAAKERLGTNIKLLRREPAPTGTIAQRWIASGEIDPSLLEAEGLSWQSMKIDPKEVRDLAQTA